MFFIIYCLLSFIFTLYLMDLLEWSDQILGIFMTISFPLPTFSLSIHFLK